METRRVLTTSDMANINILIFGLRQDIENLQQRVDTQNDTIYELTRQLHSRDQTPDDDTIHPEDDQPALPSPPSSRSSPSPAPANQAPLSPSSPPQRSISPPATSQSQLLTSIVNQRNVYSTFYKEGFTINMKFWANSSPASKEPCTYLAWTSSQVQQLDTNYSEVGPSGYNMQNR